MLRIGLNTVYRDSIQSALAEIEVIVSSVQLKTRAGCMGKIRVLLADDHATILAQVRSILGEAFDVVGGVRNGRDAVEEVQRLDPDVLVIDISMPVLNGLQAVSELQSKKCRTKVVFLTVHEDQDYIDAAFSAGASGYVIKSRVTTDLIPAIREALEGHRSISRPMST